MNKMQIAERKKKKIINVAHKSGDAAVWIVSYASLVWFHNAAPVVLPQTSRGTTSTWTQAPTPSAREPGCWAPRWGRSRARSASSSTTSSRGRRRAAWGSCWGTATRRRRCCGFSKETRGLTGRRAAPSCPRAPKSTRWGFVSELSEAAVTFNWL